LAKFIFKSAVIIIVFNACIVENGTKSESELYPEKNYIL